MTAREIEEYKALRATIRERGTARHWILLAGIAVWATLTLALAFLGAVPVAVLVPLTVLVATFEAIVALHIGVERVGRYLQVFYETDGNSAQWEHAAMHYGRTFGGGGIDALFSPLFWVATVFNLIPAVHVDLRPVEWMVLLGVHLLFAWRIWSAKRQAAVQRAVDLERFTKLRSDSNGSAPSA
ncbi:MAG: hypothetical protein QM736_11730 [Vicinamibacterales bacterium]